MQLDPRLEHARSFHGHLGPCLVLGLRMGDMVVREFQGAKYFGIRIVVNCPPQPPPSCVLDGLQLSTGCTMGKRNLILEPGQMPIAIRATLEETGQTVAAVANPEPLAEAQRRMKAEGEEPASLWYYGLSDDVLFTRTD